MIAAGGEYGTGDCRESRSWARSWLRFSGRTESKKHLGAVGILTNGLFTRAEMWQGPLACALMPFLHPELYPTPTTGETRNHRIVPT